MRSGFRTYLAVVGAVLVLVPAFEERCFSQQSGGVFVGRGKIARPADTRDRERAGRAETPNPRLDPPEHVLILERECLDEVNRVRVENGLRPLILSQELLAVARVYSKRMAEESFFSHVDPEGRNVRQRVTEAGIRWRVLGENLAYSSGFVNPVAATMHGWLESPGHRRNIMDAEYRYSAVGVWISSNGTVYFTEIFLRP